MTSLLQFQRRFAACLLQAAPDPSVQARLGLDSNRFPVHANNVRISLRCALESAFPVTRQLVGAEFFATMADCFVTDQPPRVGWLSAYGAEFPAFVIQYPAAHGLGYLADVARLEWARIHAANTADTPGLDMQWLAGLAPEVLGNLRLSLHPATTLIASDFPVFDIWRAHNEADTEDILEGLDLAAGPQSVLIVRLGPMEIGVTVPEPGDGALLMALAERASFGVACQAAIDAEASYDLSTGLGRIAAMRALSQLSGAAPYAAA